VEEWGIKRDTTIRSKRGGFSGMKNQGAKSNESVKAEARDKVLEIV